MGFSEMSDCLGQDFRLRWHATHDALTGLMNRKEFERCLAEMVEDASQGITRHVMFYLDLDQFKVVNNTCGHIAGDSLLSQLATALRSQTRSTDIVARLGGDEFGILLKNCSLEQCKEMAEKIRNVVSQFRFTWQDKVFSISASIGVAEINRASGSSLEVLRSVDISCYTAKDQGRNRVCFYKEDDTSQTKKRDEMALVTRILKAFEENRLSLFYQTIQATAPQLAGTAHFEVLIRMQGEDGAMIPPASFIPAAEQYNLMPTIDRWVIRSMFQKISETMKDSHSSALPMIAINVSGTMLNDDFFPEFVTDQIVKHQIPPGVVCFEITETAVIENLEKVGNLIVTLKQHGIAFALDDFGIGSSSLAYLKHLHVDYLKIDGTFIKNILTDPFDRSMVIAINQMAHTMNIKTIGEYVESDEIFRKLKDLGVDYAQGYAIAHPQSLENFIWG